MNYMKLKQEYAHLHVHTEYSLLDGYSRIKKLVEMTKALGMNHLAITDHGHLYGAMEFYKACKAGGINPVVGLEAYIVPDHKDKPKFVKGEKRYHHQILLAETTKGYHNLMELNTIANTDGMYGNYPRIDHKLLKQYGEGLIATSSCLGGEIPQLLLKGDKEGAYKVAKFYLDTFGPKNYYLEVQSHAQNPEQSAVNKQLYQMSHDLGIECVATADLHYVEQGDAHLHETLLCVQTQGHMSNPKHFRFQGDDFFLKSPDQMYRAFAPEIHNALLNTVRIAERCSINPLEAQAAIPTYFPIPDIHASSKDYLYALCLKGVEERFGYLTDAIKERLDLEFNMIAAKFFVDYFLIEWDAVNFCRTHDIRCSARGSAAGSLMAYVLGISNVDPLRYQLPFERFFTIEREDKPDIDLDIMDSGRGDLIEYITKKYGNEYVAQIVTFGTMATKYAIKDVARVYEQQQLGDQLSRFIPKDAKDLKTCVATIPELQAVYKKDANARNILSQAMELEGITRSTGVHAAGVIIGNKPLRNFIPLRLKDSKDASQGLITEYEQKHLEEQGLWKFDFLGLTNLTIIAHTIKNIKRTRNETVIMEKIPLDDVPGDDEQNKKRAKAFELLAKGEVIGLFQLEGDKMKEHIKSLKPTRIEDVMAMIALYRPGPMDSIPHFIDARFGREKITYLDNRLKEWLDESYGVIVYQDQVLFIAVNLAGFSWGKTHKFRKALSKKNAEEVASYRASFVEGCVKNSMDRGAAEQLFTLIEPFGGYGFNKAHAASYAVVAFYGAYLKANYTAEFMAATLTASSAKSEKIGKVVVESKRMGVAILGPDINKSVKEFTVEDGNVRFGLLALSGIGEGPIYEIEKAQKTGPFKSLADFTTRCDVSKTVIEVLIKVGAMDSMGGLGNRHQLLASIDRALKFAKSERKAQNNGMMSLFGDLDEIDNAFDFVMSKDAPEISRMKLLGYEMELMGVYISDHPLTYLTHLFTGKVTHTIVELSEELGKQTITLGGMVRKVHSFQTKKGDTMCMVQFEDVTGTLPITIFPKTYEETEAMWVEGSFAIVSGTVQMRNDELQILCNGATQLQAVEEEMEKKQRQPYHLWITIRSDQMEKVQLVYEKLCDHAGSDHYEIVVSNEESDTRLVPDDNTVNYSTQLKKELEAILGSGALKLQAA